MGSGDWMITTAAQLTTNKLSLTPSSIHDADALSEYGADFIYFEGIRFIKQIKSSAPFAETSPMLNDISHIADWAKVCAGLMRLFQGEVLCKFPVVQHMLFGSMIPCTWRRKPE